MLLPQHSGKQGKNIYWSNKHETPLQTRHVPANWSCAYFGLRSSIGYVAVWS